MFDIRLPYEEDRVSKYPSDKRCKVTILTIQTKKERREPITMLTAYDYSSGLLVDRAGADQHLKPLVAALIDAGCTVRGCAEACAADERVDPATEKDWSTEYLDTIISLRVVDGVDEAMAHIADYGSQHTDTIVTDNAETAERFLIELDSAIVLHNASTQFADGGEFGFGAEIGIATGKMHARGPVGLEQLTSFKYQVRGSGQTRP